MEKTHDDSKTLHDCSFCLGTGIGRADGIPCWRCHGRGFIDSRADLEDAYEIKT